MIIKKLNIIDSFVVTPKKKLDNRGSFYRIYCSAIFKKKKIRFSIQQSNISFNKKKYTLRGFHYQKFPYKEDKLITVINGSIYNVTIDLRKNSPSFLKKSINKLNSKTSKLLYVPAGCANAFLTTSENTIVQYFMGAHFEMQEKKNYKGFAYNEKFFKIKWPHKPNVISKKDSSYARFNVNKL